MGQRDLAQNIDIVRGAHGDVAVGRRQSPVQVDVIPSSKQNTSVGRGDVGAQSHIHIAPTANLQVSVGGGDWLVDVDVSVGQQRQRCRGRTRCPCDGIVDVNVTAACSRRADGDAVGYQLG